MIEKLDVGPTVACDGCNKDFTLNNESGGLLFGSYGYGPCCAQRMTKTIRECGEEEHIKGHCPPGMSFRDWILRLRDGNNTVTILSGEDAAVFNRGK